MADHIGIVIQTEPDNFARILADRKGACAGCHQGHVGCHSCLTNSNKVESRVANPVHANVGDLVRIHMSMGNLLLGTAIIYLLPVLGLIIGAVAGPYFITGLGLTVASSEIIGAVLGLIISLTALYLLDRSTIVRKRIKPIITKVLSSDSGYRPVKKESCCG